MPFIVHLADAQAEFPEYTFVAALTPSEQKAAFHVRDATGLDLCLKIIAPNYAIDRLNREIRALESLDHPNVVRLKEYTFSSKQGQQRHYLVEEFVAGQDLSAARAAGQPWARVRAADFFAQLCDGLGALRSVDLVHRDLKPNNVRVRLDGSPVIIDFGLARHLDLPALTNTADGARIGTPAYFAPEQFTGTKHDIDHRTDLFAAGVLLYEALVGKHPFLLPGMSMAQLEDAVCTSDHHLAAPEFAGLPAQWKVLTGRLLEKDRARRPSGADQVAVILRKLRNI